MSITMKDIAMLAGVSRQAVSAVLNNTKSCRVSEEKKREIRRVANELNYVPNSAARSLKGISTNCIGVMGSILDSGFNSALIGELSQMLKVRNYNILYCNYGYSNYNTSDFLTQLLSYGVDGIVIQNSEDRHVLEKNQRVPYLFFSVDNLAGTDIGVDHKYGGYLATKHLLDHGHNKVALLVMRESSKNSPRHKGWKQAHNELNIDIQDDFVIDLRALDGQVSKVIQTIQNRSISAVFAMNDYMGAKLIVALQQRGIRVPEDVAVIGYDGYTFSEFCMPSLTTVIQPIRLQAEAGMSLLLERITKKELHSKPANQLVKPILHKGGSCGCKTEPFEYFFRLNTFSMLEKDYKMNFDVDLINSKGIY